MVIGEGLLDNYNLDIINEKLNLVLDKLKEHNLELIEELAKCKIMTFGLKRQILSCIRNYLNEC